MLRWAKERDAAGRDDRARLERARARRRCRRARAQARRRSGRGPRCAASVLVAGGGAPNAVALHRARDAGLGGFEFASAIPGTAGGGVRMNAGAYGREWKDVMIDAVVVDADYVRTLTPTELGLSYRHSALRSGEVVAQVRFQLEPELERGGQGVRVGAARAAQGDAADEQAHLRQRLQEPGGRARRRAADRGVRAQGAPDRRRRSSRPGTRTSSRTRAVRRAPTASP